MSGPLARALFRLPSKEYQERFVLCGDKDNYVILDELVDDALYWARKNSRLLITEQNSI